MIRVRCDTNWQVVSLEDDHPCYLLESLYGKGWLPSLFPEQVINCAREKRLLSGLEEEKAVEQATKP